MTVAGGLTPGLSSALDCFAPAGARNDDLPRMPRQLARNDGHEGADPRGCVKSQKIEMTPLYIVVSCHIKKQTPLYMEELMSFDTVSPRLPPRWIASPPSGARNDDFPEDSTVLLAMTAARGLTPGPNKPDDAPSRWIASRWRLWFSCYRTTSMPPA
jgi:hypothetical protein